MPSAVGEVADVPDVVGLEEAGPGEADRGPFGCRDQVESLIVQSWGQLEAAKAQVNATQAQVTAAEVALNGVREEARVGQRTTLDVLNAQLALVNARVSLVTQGTGSLSCQPES